MSNNIDLLSFFGASSPEGFCCPDGYISYVVPPPYAKDVISDLEKKVKSKSLIVAGITESDKIIFLNYIHDKISLKNFLEENDQFLNYYINLDNKVIIHLEYWEDLAVFCIDKNFDHNIHNDISQYQVDLKDYLAALKTIDGCNENFLDNLLKLSQPTT